jgi:hypothetical protein
MAMNRITVEYHCERPSQKVKWTITANKGETTANCKWEFDPPLDDNTKDPAGVLTMLLEGMAGLVKHG